MFDLQIKYNLTDYENYHFESRYIQLSFKDYLLDNNIIKKSLSELKLKQLQTHVAEYDTECQEFVEDAQQNDEYWSDNWARCVESYYF